MDSVRPNSLGAMLVTIYLDRWHFIYQKLPWGEGYTKHLELLPEGLDEIILVWMYVWVYTTEKKGVELFRPFLLVSTLPSCMEPTLNK